MGEVSEELDKEAVSRGATAGVGQKYGSGYGLEVKARWMERIVVRTP